MKKIASKAKNLTKSIDLFSNPVSLTYKGKDKFQTVYGGILSSVILSICFAYFLRLSIVMFTRGETAKSKNTIINDLTQDFEYFNVTKEDFSFFFNLNDGNNKILSYDPTYINITISQVSSELNATNGKVLNSSKLFFFIKTVLIILFR